MNPSPSLTPLRHFDIIFAGAGHNILGATA
jgi:hypothetical protein